MRIQITNTAGQKISDGGWHRSPDMPDNYGGFFGNTKFIYGDESKGEYFIGTNHTKQEKTISFVFGSF